MHIFKVHRVSCCCDLHLRARFPTDGRSHTNRYDYEDDSNLGVDDDIQDNEPVSDSKGTFLSSRSSTNRPTTNVPL